MCVEHSPCHSLRMPLVSYSPGLSLCVCLLMHLQLILTIQSFPTPQVVGVQIPVLIPARLRALFVQLLQVKKSV